jgi:hypothetical protein
MVTLVKHEWHQADVQYAIELDEALLSEIYPDLDEDEIATMLQQIEDGEIDVEEVVNYAFETGVELEWDHQYDDMWTMRKGGYDVTHELGDENSWVDNTPESDTHKCTKCKWTGGSYDGTWVWEDGEGKELEEGKQVCPMCDSDLELTPDGVLAENEKRKRMAEIEAMMADVPKDE